MGLMLTKLFHIIDLDNIGNIISEVAQIQNSPCEDHLCGRVCQVRICKLQLPSSFAVGG
jgi:hypothetical protein